MKTYQGLFYFMVLKNKLKHKKRPFSYPKKPENGQKIALKLPKIAG